MGHEMANLIFHLESSRNKRHVENRKISFSLVSHLGMEENAEWENKVMKEEVIQQYYSRVRHILKSILSGRNKFNAISEHAHPVLAYIFGNHQLETIRYSKY